MEVLSAPVPGAHGHQGITHSARDISLTSGHWHPFHSQIRALICIRNSLLLRGLTIQVHFNDAARERRRSPSSSLSRGILHWFQAMIWKTEDVSGSNAPFRYSTWLAFLQGPFYFRVIQIYSTIEYFKRHTKTHSAEKLIKWLGSHLCTFFNQLTYSLFYVINIKEE